MLIYFSKEFQYARNNGKNEWVCFENGAVAANNSAAAAIYQNPLKVTFDPAEYSDKLFRPYGLLGRATKMHMKYAIDLLSGNSVTGVLLSNKALHIFDMMYPEGAFGPDFGGWPYESLSSYEDQAFSDEMRDDYGITGLRLVLFHEAILNG